MSANLFPRPIRPELIEVGDMIEVEYPASGGITLLKRGIVSAITAHGANRHFLTDQNKVISTWTIGQKCLTKFTLIRRSYGGELLEMFEKEGRL